MIFSKQKPGKEEAPTNAHLDMVRTNLGCVFWGKKIQDWILKSKNGFYVSLLYRLIQLLGPDCIKGTGESSPRPRVDFSVSLKYHDPINLFGKEMQNAFLDLRILSWISQRNTPLFLLIIILLQSRDQIPVKTDIMKFKPCCKTYICLAQSLTLRQRTVKVKPLY